MSKNDKKRVFINSIIVTTATTVDKFLFFAITIIVARYLSKEEYGEYTTALGYAHYFAILTSLGLNKTLVRFINLDPHNEHIHFSNSMFIRAISTLALYTLMAFSLFFTTYSNNIIYLALIFGLVRMGNEFLNGYYAHYDAKEKFLIPSIFSSSFAFLFLVATVFIVIFKGTYFHFAYSRLVIVIVTICIISFLTFRSIQLILKTGMIKDFLKTSIPFGLQTVYYNFYHRGNIIILSNMIATVYTGIFQNAFIFFLTLSFIPDNFIRILVPYLYKNPFHENKEKFQFTFNIFSKTFAIVSVYVGIILYLFAPHIIILFFGSKYDASIGVLKILALGVPFLFNVATIFLIALDMQKYNTRILGIAAIINITSNILLIYFFKAHGAAIAVVTTYGIIFILTHAFLFYKKIVQFKIAFVNYIRLIIITIFTYTIFHYIKNEVYWILNVAVISCVFAIAVLLLMIRKDDLRILQQALGIYKNEK